MKRIFLALLLAIACAESTQDPAAIEPVDPGLEECAVCGMTVMEQPAPRAQVIHRHGERRFFCSVSDLRAYLETPSALGSPVATYVEVSAPEVDPDVAAGEPSPTASPLQWVNAEGAVYVFGLERPDVMGIPALAFSDFGAASAVAERLGTEPVSWASVRATPFDQVPKGER